MFFVFRKRSPVSLRNSEATGILCYIIILVFLHHIIVYMVLYDIYTYIYSIDTSVERERERGGGGGGGWELGHINNTEPPRRQ